MRAEEFLSVYTSDGLVQTLAERIRTSQNETFHLKRLSGSLDAVLFAAVYKATPLPHLLILENKEEANYFLTDLQNLLGEIELLFFPMSYKKPYDYEYVENANIVMRSETLTRLNENPKKTIVITYPDALAEKVVNKKLLVDNTLIVKKGALLSSGVLEKFFQTHDFEKVDFVHNAGQFAIRGGIVDVFSFAHTLPYRIELLGDQVDSIRSFDSGSQLSVEDLKKVNITPGFQTRLIREKRQSLLDFIAPKTKIWIKDVKLISDRMNRHIEAAAEQWNILSQRTGNANVGCLPEQLFESSSDFLDAIKHFVKIEFGHTFHFPPASVIEIPSSSQTSFNKNFDMVATALADAPLQGYSNFIAAEQPKQLERLHDILEEINTASKFESLAFSLRSGFIDRHTKVNCYTDHQLFQRFYRSKEKIARSKAITLRELYTLQPGDFVTHIDYGIGKFAGLEKIQVSGKTQEAIRIVFRDNDMLYASIHSLHKISKYAGKEGTPPVMSKLGTGEWEAKKARVKGKVKDIAKELIELYAKRKQTPGHAFQSDGLLQAELEASFLYVDTPDQAKATEEVKRDMETPHPMDRLLCGDVGFGKTEVAIRAAFKALNEGKQVAVLVPTTILAMQHYRTFCERLSPFSARIKYISRFKSSKEIQQAIKATAEGASDILIGTHRLVSKDVRFNDLGLLIIDEEQKFGVKIKDRLKELKVNVDTLTLTATPIPRTLQFSLMGTRNLSIMTTPPPNRQAVTTELHPYNETLIRDAIHLELQRRGQVFFVHNQIKDIEYIANIIFKLVPDSRIGIAHGQMEGNRLEKVMVRFINGEYDILVSTNIIESGLDIPNANTIIINQAHTFGLSDLHQMRGRVGRSNKKAFCYLLTPSISSLSAESRKRLTALEEFSELGDGLRVAMRDLEIRGAGNLLGSEQTGFINDLGFDMYHKILDDAIRELKEHDFKSLFTKELTEKIIPMVKECTIETDLEILIPETYVKNISERLALYTRLDALKNEDALMRFENTLKDRFGPVPEPVIQLMNSLRIRWISEELGIERLILKAEKIKSYLISDKAHYFQSEPFEKILEFVQANPKNCKMENKKNKCILTIHDVPSVEKALRVLKRIIKTKKQTAQTPLPKIPPVT